MACKESTHRSAETSGTNANHISNLSPSSFAIITKNENESEKTTIKLKSSIEKIKDRVINNWMENGFIENMRGQIRCQLIGELKNPFKHQRNGGTHSMNHLSLTRKIVNSIIIEYLTKYKYNYSLSVFKSEIGGELIGSLSYNDTYDQLQLARNPKTCILEQLIHSNKHKNNSINLDYKTNGKAFEISQAKKEKICVKEAKLSEKNEASKKIDIECDNEKYDEIYTELMNALKRENKVKCLLDEENMKLKSAKREIKYLEQLLVSQNNANYNDDTDDNDKKCNDKFPPHKEVADEPNKIVPNVSNVATQKNEIHNVLVDKYKNLELDLKKRLQRQAMLETDTRKLTYHTKQFFTQLNQRKTQTTQIINKLQNATPNFYDKYVINSNVNDFVEINAEKKEEFEVEKRKHRQSYIYYNLDKLKKERNESQQQIRNRIEIQQIGDYKESDVANHSEIEECNEFGMQNDEIVASDESLNQMEMKSVSSNTQMAEKIIDNNGKVNILNDINDTNDNVIKSDEMESSLPIIEEDKEHSVSDIAPQANAKNEWDILEKEKLEQELMDDDFSQSESFSGVDFLQTDFLEQYQKHIENLNSNK